MKLSRAEAIFVFLTMPTLLKTITPVQREMLENQFGEPEQKLQQRLDALNKRLSDQLNMG